MTAVEVFMTFFCKISRNLCLLIFNIAISRNISTVQMILFFDVSIIFCDFFNTKKGDPPGCVWTAVIFCHGRILPRFPAVAEVGAGNLKKTFSPGPWLSAGLKGGPLVPV